LQRCNAPAAQRNFGWKLDAGTQHAASGRTPYVASRRRLTSQWWIVIGLYGAAKLMEATDAAVFDAAGFISGHTLKHLLAAGAAGWLRASAINSGNRR